MTSTVFDKNDAYDWISFQKYYSTNIIIANSRVERNAIIASDLKRVLARICKGDGFYIKKNSLNDMFDYCKKLDDIQISYKITGDDQPATETIKLSKLLKSPNFLSIYSNIVFKPELEHLKDEFNIWTGFQATETKSTEERALEHFKYYVKTIWANENDELNDYK